MSVVGAFCLGFLTVVATAAVFFLIRLTFAVEQAAAALQRIADDQ